MTNWDDGIKQLSVQHPTYLSHYTDVIIMGLYTVYAIIPACFLTFFCSAIPTSPYILKTFLIIDRLTLSIEPLTLHSRLVVL